MSPTTYPVPKASLKNWRSAELVLERVQNDEQRDQLATLVKGLGVHGSAGLSYAAQTACWLSGAYGKTPEPRRTMKLSEAEWITGRVTVELRDLIATKPGLWPRAQKHVRG